MNKKYALIITLGSILCSSNVLAGTIGSAYGGVQYVLGSYNEDGFDEVNPTVLGVRFGKFITESFSVEGRLGMGLQDDSIQAFGFDVELEVDTMLGVYGVGHANISPTSSVYGLVGFTRGEVTATIPGFGSVSDDDSSLSFGVGANLGASDDVAFNIEFTQYLSKSDYDFSAISFGATFGF